MQKILIVDDERSMRELLQLVFRRARLYGCGCGKRQRKPWNELNKDVIDIVVSDVKMPDCTGIELLKQIRMISSDTVFILMTAFATIETARQAFKLGADDFIQKPFDVEELKIIVNNASERKTAPSGKRVAAEGIARTQQCQESGRSFTPNAGRL